MCGVFATTRRDLWRDSLPAVLAALQHRGPDDDGVWEDADAGVLLAHTRLEIIGLGEPGDQPARSRDGAVTAVFNGEIYNYRGLGPAVGDAAPVSDTQVLADGLSAVGPSFVDRARGMYAFVAWDARRGTLVVGRDPYGIKPLYLLRHPSGGVTLASELPPLLLSPDARRVDTAGLAHYLAFGHTGPVITLFEAVTKVPPGSVLQWTREPTGWSEDGRRIEPTIDGAAEAGLRAALDDTVDAHLVADVEVGVFLSSGVDSTLLAAVAAPRSPGMRSFTLSFPETPSIDESDLAAANARRLGTRHRVIPVGAADMAAAARDFVGVQGEPFGDAAALPLTVLARAAAEDVKVVLTGEGADELFGGYGRYRVSRLIESPVVRVTGLVTKPLAAWMAARRDDRPRSRAVEALLWGGGVRSHAALLGTDVNAMGGLPGAAEVTTLARSDWAGIVNGHRGAEAARRFDLARWLPNVYLEKTDRATMASSLEARVPYLDHRFASAVAAARGGSVGKGPLRDELVARLPDVEQPERKKGLAVDVSALARDRLRPQLRHELEAGDSVLRRWLGASGAEVFADRSARSGTTAFRIAMLGLWEEAFPAAVAS